MAERNPAGSRRSGPPRRLVQAFEPVANVLAGRRWFPLWAIVHHRGRRSGAEYATPVAIIPTTNEAVLIGLPWGVKTNWAQNVVAAHGATLRWKGRDREVGDPRIIGSAEAAAFTQKPFRRLVASGRFPGFLVLSLR